jgi:hypothetical protein
MIDEKELSKIEEKIKLAKQTELALLEKKEKYLKQNRIKYFRPLYDKQLSFFENCERARRAIFAGNRAGKSTIGVVEDICWALGERPFFPVDHPLRYKGIPDHGVKGLVIGEDWDKIKEIFTDSGKNTDRPGKFFYFTPEANISGTHTNQNGVVDIIYIENTVNGRKRKSAIYFDTVKSFKNNGAAHESSDWDFIHIDEPIPEDMWKAMSRGLIDRAGKSWWLMTPLKEAWMYYYIVDALKDEKISRHFWMTMADMDDNPTLSTEEKALYLSSLTPEEVECRKKGLPTALGTLVYPYFNHETMVLKECPKGWKDKLTPPDSWNLGYAIDPHTGRPHAVLFVAWCEQSIVVYDEIFSKCLIEDLCSQIQARLGGRRPTVALCDPCAWNPDIVTGQVWASHFWSGGCHVQRGSKDKKMGTILTNDIIRMAAQGRGKTLHVLSHCRTFLNEIRKYSFDDNGNPVDKDDHMMENFRRLASVNQFRYRDSIIYDSKINRFTLSDYGTLMDTEIKEFDYSSELGLDL